MKRAFMSETAIVRTLAPSIAGAACSYSSY